MLTNLAVFAALLSLVDGSSFARVRIFNPKQGEIWFFGEKRTIIWREAYIPPPPMPHTLNITLHRASEPNFVLHLATDYPLSEGKFVWTIPTNLANADDYVIYLIPNRVFPRPGRPNIRASRSKPFSIVGKQGQSALKVLQPKSGAVWYGGQYRNIQWSFKGLTSDATVSIFIQDTLNGFVGKPTPYTIASKIPVVPGPNVVGFRWQVPYDFRTSTGYQITLVAEYPAGLELAPLVATSNGTFTINQVGDAGHGTPTILPFA